MSSSFILLQGTASFFFPELARALQTRGHVVQKVNFCGGDLVYSGLRDQYNYAGTAEELESWYSQLLTQSGATDIVLFGDCRPVHMPIHSIAASHGARVHVFEEGYVRPNWITLERFGVNGRSQLRCDADWLKEHRHIIPPVPESRHTGYNLRERAYHDIRYRLANTLYARRFPHYVSHRPRNGAVEYAGLAIGLALTKKRERYAAEVTARLLGGGNDYYLVPLQLNSDAQVVHHSPFGGISDFAQAILRSFALNAPQDASLVFKSHPLDTGLIDHRRNLLDLARDLGVDNRVYFIKGGHLPTLLSYARGVAVINSTVGLSALHHGRALIALGTAVYDMPGMTWQGTLDDFWCSASSPDREVYQTFLNYVIDQTQINGDFYTRSGIAMAVTGVIDRLEPCA
ncbi:capsule biosynthesis protein [Paraburkholderia aspalathi]|jgi:capsular polysaccharide export protein|uniref:Capsular polysaccharide export protein n=1 Tax=Paraburkholderia aspalathi TaxID=1324617 RepID=A0A1I7EML5_9BURK|nr:capsular biosynthesis protein [Paraburkholderia aspalathi]SFU25107.1 capsular polysaccharide export protein [Paraburkholderia aspalathi]